MKNDIIDTSFSMYLDSNGKDPDSYSETLNNYHHILWDKPLPNGSSFELIKKGIKKFSLELKLKNEVITLSSDSIINSYSNWNSMKEIIEEINKDDINTFRLLGSTIGGYIVFPSKKINKLPTINAIRGMNHVISDRFDFTLECIKRYYNGTDSPLYNHLKRYDNFFELFINFESYVDFFLLNDLVDDNYNIKFWLPFTDFKITAPLPKSLKEYNLYKKNVINFIMKRNERLQKKIKLD